ncbi:ABC-type antimicrobial peptide transport system, ATPase component [hydrothermal vent metagenome]|uniref:ABC-type antimicrobial peptide transport system, ATPase component n=1 Tax=hydrothermal vent metagenome TaxID=652676 RepID=A0A3B0WEF0_9ZZZZ
MIKIKNLTKVFRTQGETITALNAVNLHIPKAEFVAIMGRSGSGKSTLLNIIGCMDKATSGGYYLANADVSQLNDDELSQIRNERIGFIFQGFHLLPRLSALENVMLPLRYVRDNIAANSSAQKAEKLLAKVGLSDRLHHMPNQLSGGQIQRVAIARALINDPDILLADEPTGNLDSNISKQIMQLLTELNQAGQTIVMVTHEDDIAANANRVIHFLDGETIK